MILSSVATSSSVLMLIWPFLACPGRFFYFGLGGTSYSLFPFLHSLLQYMLARRLVSLNTNADCMLLSGLLAAKTFEITFLGSGVGWIIATSKA